MNLPKKLIKAIENAGFSVSKDDNNMYDFGKYSSAGQDFHFHVDTGECLGDFLCNIFAYYQGFDVSEETYYWLDDTGHGKNGAPYDMRDIYNDMEECEGFIDELYEIVREFC